LGGVKKIQEGKLEAALVRMQQIIFCNAYGRLLAHPEPCRLGAYSSAFGLIAGIQPAGHAVADLTVRREGVAFGALGVDARDVLLALLRCRSVRTVGSFTDPTYQSIRAPSWDPYALVAKARNHLDLLLRADGTLP
jgi:hypothetical protein